MNIAFPNITATGTQALEQIKSYLFRLSEQLNYELNRLSTETTEIKVTTAAKESAAEKSASTTPQAQFNALKSLIINSADIVNAYYDEINKKLTGEYVAKSDYGTFKEQTESDIAANSTRIDQNYSNIQEISSYLTDEGNETLLVNGRIRSGLLDTVGGVPIYGVEVGQTTEIGGAEVFKGYARFTAERLSFYDGDVEVAYFSSNKLYITNAEILSSLTVGDYTIKANADGGVTFVWSGQ